MTREEWLNKLTKRLKPWFRKASAEIPENLRISCGWPAKKVRTRVGECWSHKSSADGHFEVFVSPMKAGSYEVAATLVHELVHAVVGTKCGHRAPFKNLATAVGLEGKMTATYAGEELVAHLKGLIEKLGPYPHAELTLDEQKKQSTRMCKVECPDCGYLVRTTRKWIEVGVPTCVCGTEMQAV